MIGIDNSIWPALKDTAYQGIHKRHKNLKLHEKKIAAYWNGQEIQNNIRTEEKDWTKI